MRGSIRKRGSTWTVLWSTADPASGNRRQHSKGGFKKKEPSKPAQGDSAREYLNSIVGNVQDGSWRPDKAMTVKQLLEEHWLPAQKLRGLRPATVEQSSMVVNSWLVPNIGGIKVSALTAGDVQQLVEKLRTETTPRGRKGLSPRSAQLAVATLKAACAWAVENGLLGRNPILGARLPRFDRPTMKAWSIEDAKEFLDRTKTDRLGFVWALLFTRGLRRGEACGLRWSDVDLERGFLRITRTRVVVAGVPMDSTPKTTAGRRTLPLDDMLVALLRAHKARQAAERLVAGETYQDQGFLVADELGRPYHPETVARAFASSVAKHGLPPIRLHDCRHTAASLMLANGVPTKVVTELLGHANPSITLSLYAHVLPGMAQEAGEQLSAMVLG